MAGGALGEPAICRSSVVGDEARVVDAFCAGLERDGWTVMREAKFVDVAAERGDEHLHAEAKGRTTAVGLNVDTLYGQLLRRVRRGQHGTVGRRRCCHGGKGSLARPPGGVRRRLRIDVYEVTDDGEVIHR